MPSQTRQPTLNAEPHDYSEDVCYQEDESQDFGSNSVQGAVVTSGDGSGGGDNQVNSAVQDMGQVSDLSSGFTRTAGSVVDALVPNVGDKGKVQINVNIPVDQSGTVHVAFEFVSEIERDENGIKGKIKVGGGVLAKFEADLYFVTFDAFARAMVFGYIESYGDSGAEMFQLMSLGLQQRVNSVSKTVADAVWSRGFIDETIGNMDDDDYVESGLGLDFSAGIKASSSIDGDSSASAGAGVTAQTGTRLTSDGRNGLTETGVSQIAVTIKGSADPFGVEGKLTAKLTDGNDGTELSGIEGELSGEAMIDADQLNELVVGGRWLSGVIGQVAGIIQEGSGLVTDASAARKAGALASFISQSSGTGVLAEAASARALSQLEGLGVKLGHKLTVKGTWDESKGFGFECSLERVSQIEFGENPRDLIYVLVENLQRVFQIKIGG